MMACRCGAVMVSDGLTWTCPIKAQDLRPIEVEPDVQIVKGQIRLVAQPMKFLHMWEHSQDFADQRRIRFQSAQPAPRVSPPHSMGPRMRSPFRRSRLHKGKKMCCESCNPMSFRHYRRLEAKFAAMRSR